MIGIAATKDSFTIQMHSKFISEIQPDEVRIKRRKNRHGLVTYRALESTSCNSITFILHSNITKLHTITGGIARI